MSDGITRYVDGEAQFDSAFDGPLCKPEYTVCDTCGPICAPKCQDPCRTFRARDAIRIKEFEVERQFDIRSACGDRPFYATQRCIRLELKRVEGCRWDWGVDALSVDGDGFVRFRWPASFLAALPGYYHGRFLVDSKETINLVFYKPFVKHNVHSSKAVETNLCTTCSGSPCCCGARPDVEQEFYAENPADCGGCDVGCN